MTRTVATALPVWLAVVVATVVAAFTLPSDQWWNALPVIAAAATIVMFVIQVSLQSKDGFVTRMLVTVTGTVVLLAIASAATALVAVL